MAGGSLAARQTARTSHRAQLGLAPSDSLETSIPNAASRSRSSTALWPWVGHGRTPLAGSLLQASLSVLSLVRPSAFHGLRSRKGSRSNFTSHPCACGLCEISSAKRSTLRLAFTVTVPPSARYLQCRCRPSCPAAHRMVSWTGLFGDHIVDPEEGT